MTEDQLHASVADYLRLVLPADALAHHSPNGLGVYGWKAKGKAKRFGMVKGWPDIEIVYRGFVYFIELKAPGRRIGNTTKGRGSLTTDQRGCHQLLRDAGADVETCWSLDDVKEALFAWRLIDSAEAA